uniref:ABC transporter ATP-binding protein n=1 Tax=Herbidospora sakaeratensis TaxID=564415 RepID=UPI0007822A4A|nr:ABC transporter ATP-binding protein [Herbidospora sakaeratensis]
MSAPEGVVRRLSVLLRPERPRVLAVAALTVFSIGFLVSGPVLLGAATDILFEGRDPGRLAPVLAAVAAVYVLSALLSWVQARVLTGVTQRTMYRLREAIEEKLTRLPVRYFDRHPRGDILSRAVNDVGNLNTALQEGLNQLTTSALTLLGTLGVMFWISPLLAAVSLATVPVVLTVTFLIARRSEAQFTAQWEETGHLTALAEETYAGHALVLAYGRRAAATAAFGERNDRLRRAAFSAQFLSGAIFPTVVFVGNLNYVVIAAFGGYQVATGAITLGAVQAFIQYSQQFTSPVIQIAGQLNVLQSGIASAGRVFALLDAPEEPFLPARPADPGAVVPGAHRVRLEGVGFRYDPATPLIEDFTLEAAPGQTVAIVGPTGAGKTTVVNLLVRFYEIDRGRIVLDDVDYRDLGRDEVRRRFGMVLQDPWLFHGTVRDNIAYGRDGAGDDEIVAAARAAHADEFVRALPDGYATVLDGAASTISSGQRQLLTIARAFLADPGILILDEATSNIDTRTEAMVQAAMARLRAGRTSFVIAHRFSTIHSADTIVVMDAGRVVEQGTHAELLSRRGFYHDLYNRQFVSS